MSGLKFLLVAIGVLVLSFLRIPVISALAGIVVAFMLLAALCLFIWSFLFGGSGDVSGHDRALRNRYKDF